MNRRIALKTSPETRCVATDLTLDTGPVPEPGPGQVLVRNRLLSLDPYQGIAIKGRHMSGRIDPGMTMPGETIGTVVASHNPDVAVGTRVQGRGGWQEYAVLAEVAPLPAANAAVPDSAYLGVLGMPGLTAYAGTVFLAEPKPGQTFVVSAATGAVGSAAGQIARNMGARTVAIAGSAEKCAFATEQLGFAAAVNYREEGFEAALSAACPDGIDAYFDNAGGRVLEIVIQRLALGARIVLCGMMEQYGAVAPLPGPALGPIVGKRAHIHGLVVYDHFGKLPEWRKIASNWIADGRLVFKEERTQGLENAPAAFERLMAGQNFGKSVVVLDAA